MKNNILYENGDFYAFSISPYTIEIRKNVSGYSELMGTVTGLDRAKRFIDRAVKYPERF